MNAPTYVILCEPDCEKLAQVVNEHLADGWELQGGVSVAATVYTDRDGGINFDLVACQAMTKKP